MASLFWDIGKQCRPRSDAASDQGLHCLLTGISIRNKIKKKIKSKSDTPNIENGLVRLIRMEKSTKQMWIITVVQWLEQIPPTV